MEFNSASTSDISATTLSATKFVVAYRDATDSDHGTAKVGTVSGTDITFGAEAEFLSVQGAWDNSAAALSATQFVVAYRDWSDASHGTAKVGTVTGTVIAFGAEAEFNSAGATTLNSVAVLSATQVVVAYRDGADSYHGTAKVGTVSGTDITFGAETEFLSENTQFISAAALSATQVVVVYSDGGDSGHGTAKVGTVSGASITFGAEAEFLSAGESQYNSVVALSVTQFVVAYRDQADLNHGTAKMGTVGGTSITFGADAEFLSADGAIYISAAALSATKFVVSYQDLADSSHGTAKVGTIPSSASLANFSSPAGFGLESEFLSADGAESISVVALDDTKFVVAYQDGADSHGTAKVGTVSGTDITFGAEKEFGTAQLVSATKLDAGKFVVAWRDWDDSNHGKAKVGTVSGTDITFGAEAKFLAGTTNNISVAALDTAKFVVAYRDDADGSHGTAKVGTVSGTDITYGAETEFLSADGAYYVSVAVFDATKFIVAYQDATDSNHGTAKVGTVTGTTITFGVEAEFLSANGAYYISSAALSATQIVVSYTDASDSNHGTAKVGTISGTSITFGAETEFHSSGAVNYISSTALSATQFVVAYADDVGGGHGTTKVGTVSGTDITFGAEEEFLSTGDGNFNSVSALGSGLLPPFSATEFVVAYQDNADSNHGTTKVHGSGVPDPYPTVVSETKIAFSGWFQKPSG